MKIKRYMLFIGTILFTFILSACASFKPKDIVPVPSNLTVSEALKDIGTGFNSLRNELGDNKLGMFPCVITVNLKVTASAEDSSKLVLDMSATAPSRSSTANLTAGASSEAERDNTIRVEIYNPGCLPKDTLGYSNPEKVKDAMLGMIVPEDKIPPLSEKLPEK